MSEAGTPPSFPFPRKGHEILWTHRTGPWSPPRPAPRISLLTWKLILPSLPPGGVQGQVGGPSGWPRCPDGLVFRRAQTSHFPHHAPREAGAGGGMRARLPDQWGALRRVPPFPTGLGGHPGHSCGRNKTEAGEEAASGSRSLPWVCALSTLARAFWAFSSWGFLAVHLNLGTQPGGPALL